MNYVARTVIAANLKALMGARPDLDTFKKITAAGGPTNGTLDRIRRADGDCSLGQLDLLAEVFGLEPWQLLVPNLDPLKPPAVLTESESELMLGLPDLKHIDPDTYERLAREIMVMVEGARASSRVIPKRATADPSNPEQMLIQALEQKEAVLSRLIRRSETRYRSKTADQIGSMAKGDEDQFANARNDAEAVFQKLVDLDEQLYDVQRELRSLRGSVKARPAKHRQSDEDEPRQSPMPRRRRASSPEDLAPAHGRMLGGMSGFGELSDEEQPSKVKRVK